MKSYMVAVMALSIFCSGCTMPTSHQPVTLRNGGITTVYSAEDSVATFMKDGESAMRFCTQTNVDSVQTSSSGFSAGVSYAGNTDELGEQSSTGDVTLGGRDSAVLLTRELMYRACELINNINMDDEDALRVYAATLDAVIKISLSQTVTGSKVLDGEPQVHPVILPNMQQTVVERHSTTASDTTASDDGSDSQYDVSQYDYTTPVHYIM